MENNDTTILHAALYDVVPMKTVSFKTLCVNIMYKY